MVKAQEWLDKKYPLEKKHQIAELDISSELLKSGTSQFEDNILTLEEFDNLKKLSFYHYNNEKLTNISLTVRNCLQLEAVNFSTSNLKLENLPILNTVYCSRLNKLEIINCPEIKHLDFSESYDISDFDFNSLNPEKLTYLAINTCYNKLKLNSLTYLTNLEELRIKTDEGSCYWGNELPPLKYLMNLTKLRSLDISGISHNYDSHKIAAGIEYLPKNLRTIDGVNVLGNYGNDFQAWREAQVYLIKQVKEEENFDLYSRIRDLENTIADWESKFQQILVIREKLAEINTKLENDLTQKEVTIKSLQKELFPLKLGKIKSEYQKLLDECFNLLNEKEQTKLVKLMEVVKKTIQEQKENDFFAQELIEERKEYFHDKLENTMIDKLCQLQQEIIKLESQVYISERLEEKIEVPLKK